MAVTGFVSVKKPGDAAGRPSGKKNYVILFDWNDVKTLTIDTDGVNVSAFTMASAKKPIAVYGTSETIACYDKLVGEVDGKGFQHLVDFSTPGDTAELAAFRNAAVNKELGAIVINCGAKDAKLAGTPCAPLRFAKDDGKDDKEGVKHEISLASEIPSDALHRIPLNLIPKTGDTEIDDFLGLTADASPEAASVGA